MQKTFHVRLWERKNGQRVNTLNWEVPADHPMQACQIIAADMGWEDLDWNKPKSRYILRCHTKFEEAR